MSDISKRRTIIFSICLSLISILLCFVVLESFLAIQYNQQQNRITSESGNTYRCTTRSEHAELIYTRIPGKCDTNAHGFRDHEYNYTKPDGVFRIVLIGDSVAEGQGIELDNTLGKVLEQKLNQVPVNEGNKVEVIVLAQSGYSTSQELFLLENEAFRYSPDVIIWSYVLNDPAHLVYHNASGELSLYYFKPAIHTASFISEKLFQISEKLKAYQCPKEYHALLHCVYRDQVEADIKTISSISAQEDTPVIFLIHPVFKKNGDFAAYPLAPLHADLGEVASSAGLVVLDLLTAYRPYKPDQLTQSKASDNYDVWHPNEKGHQVAADALFVFINETNPFQEWIDERE